MNREVIQAIENGAMNALRLYAALLTAPYYISKAFVMRPAGEPFRWKWEGAGQASSSQGDIMSDRKTY
jgi:hypothetical protein